MSQVKSFSFVCALSLTAMLLIGCGAGLDLKTYDTYTYTGTTTSGSIPSCVEYRQGIECFTQSLSDTPSLLRGYYSQGKWSPRWTSLGGHITSNPSCFRPGPGGTNDADAACIASGLDKELWVLRRVNHQWGTWQSIDFNANIIAPDGVDCVGDSCYARQRTGDKLVVGKLRSLPTSAYEYSPASDWETIGGATIISKPQCWSKQEGRVTWVDCFAWGSGKVVRWRKGYSSSERVVDPAWTHFSGLIASPPSCARRDPTGPWAVHTVCAARKSDSSFIYREMANDTEWRTVDGSAIAAAPSCPNSDTCFAVGKDQSLWRFDLAFGGGQTARSTKIRGADTTTRGVDTTKLGPDVYCLQADKIHCFAVKSATRELMHYELTP